MSTLCPMDPRPPRGRAPRRAPGAPATRAGLAALVAVALLATACGAGSGQAAPATQAPTPGIPAPPTPSSPAPAGTRTPPTPIPPATPEESGTPLVRNAAFTDPDRCPLSAVLVPSCGVLWGAAVNPDWAQGEGWAGAFRDFEALTGRPLDVVHRFHVGEELFPTPDELLRAARPEGASLFFFNWKPAPELTFAEIAAGAVDDRIDRQAAHLRRHVDGPFFLGIHHEPEDRIDPSPGSGDTAADYRAMYRHVVERLRERGVDRMVTVMTYRGSPVWSTKPWFEGLYPGDDVVDWIGFDPYVFPYPGWDQAFPAALDRTAGGAAGWPGFYTWATRTHPGKPLMLAEWGISQEFDEAVVLDHLASVRRTLRSHPALKALVYWDVGAHDVVGRTRMTGAALRRAFAELATSREVTGAPGTRP